MKYIINFVLVIALSLINFYSLSQINLEILNKNIIIRKFTKVIALDVKITYSKINNADTVILYHNEADKLYYSSKEKDNFFQLSTDITTHYSLREWSIDFSPPRPQPPEFPESINYLPQTRKIIVLSDTSVIYSLKFDADKLRAYIRGPEFKNGLNTYLSYGVNDYQYYFNSLNQKNNKSVNYYTRDIIISKNTVNIKYMYRRVLFFQVWIRNLLPPYFGKYKSKRAGTSVPLERTQ